MHRVNVRPAVWLPTIRAGSGADVFVERLVSALKNQGFRAEIHWLPRRAEYAGLSVAVPAVPSWANIAHINSWLPWRFVPENLPVVVTVHHLVHDPAFSPYRSRLQVIYHEGIIRRREMRALKRATAVTAVSSYVAATVDAFCGRHPDRVIHNWIDESVWTPMAGAKTADGRPRILVVGNASRRKGFDLLPRLAARLGAAFEIRCTGGLRGSGFFESAGVMPLGRLDEKDLIKEYREATVVVSLSRYEGFGYTALESMACGKPFVGFNTSGLREVVDDSCGCLLPVDDVDALAETVKTLVASPATIDAMGLAGRARALAKFLSANVEQYINLYQEIHARRHA